MSKESNNNADAWGRFLGWSDTPAVGMNPEGWGLNTTASAAARGTSGDTFTDIAEAARKLRADAEQFGGYYVAPPDDLITAAGAYYNSNAEAVRTALARGGADEPTTAAVLFDYGAALCGMDCAATPQQMRAALDACAPLAAYTIDKNGFFVGVLSAYQRTLTALSDYDREVKQQPDADARAAFFAQEAAPREYNDLRAAALRWILNNGYITASDFAGVEVSTTHNFLSNLEAAGCAGIYAIYSFIARYALGASSEQLRQLTPPALFSVGDKVRNLDEQTAAAVQYAQGFGIGICSYLSVLGEQLAAALSAPTVEAIEKAQETAKVIKYPPKYANLMSRALWWSEKATKDGQIVSDIVPISERIAEIVERNPELVKRKTDKKEDEDGDKEKLPFTPGLIQKAIEGVTVLLQLKRVQPVNGVYTIDTNISELSGLCGYDDANEKEKNNLLAGLHALDGIWLVYWEPNGSKVAQRLFTLEKIGVEGLDAGRLRMHVYASGFNGRPVLVSRSELLAMKAKEKGQIQRNFRFQILSKGHKEESALVDEVFMFPDKIRKAETTGDAKQVQSAKVYRQNEFSRARKKLKRWFDDWQERGIISYQLKKGPDGKNVYSWKRLQAPTAAELAEAEAAASAGTLPPEQQ